MGASESKLAFKQSIFLLASDDEISPRDPLWAQFYTLPESSGDIFALWSPNDLRNLTLNNADVRPPSNAQIAPRKNLETLIYAIVARLRALQDGAKHAETPPSLEVEVLNCMRILTRLLPYVYEAEHLREWQDMFFWQPRKPTCLMNKKESKAPIFFDGLNPHKRYPAEQCEQELGQPLGETLLEVVTEFLFFPGFAIPSRSHQDGRPDFEVLVKVWQTGIGSKQSLNCTKDNERNQMETLRLLLTLSSKIMYSQPNAIAALDVKPLTYMTTKMESRMVNGIVCSLLNTVLKYEPNSWGLSIDLSTAFGDSKKVLVTNSLQLLLVLVSYRIPVHIQPSKNQFSHALGMLHRPDDFQFINQGLNRILKQPMLGTLNYFPNLPWAPEMLSLFWELLQCNRRFRRYLIETGSIHDFVIVLLFYAINAKEEPAKQDYLLRLCVFILQTLSAEASFAKKLNAPFFQADSLPQSLRVPNFHGSFADFLICTIHTIFTTIRGNSESILCPSLLAIIRNIAPYTSKLARATSSKMMDLVAFLSSPTFLMANTMNHLQLTMMLEAINRVLEYSLQDNRRFVEVLVSNRSRFKALRTMSVEGALAELERQGQEQKDRAMDTHIPNSSRPTSIDSVRSTNAARSTALGNVPEDERFEIGDDVDDDSGVTGTTSTTASSVEQAQHLSEKARGKRPAFHLSTTSRTASNSSLVTTSTISSQPFRPTREWLETWYTHLPLDTIFKTINNARIGSHDTQKASKLRAGEQQYSTGEEHYVNDKHRRHSSTAELADQNNAAKGRSSIDSRAVDGGTSRRPSEQIAGVQGTVDDQLTAVKPPPGESFEWNSFAIGWYNALIWGRIYLQEAEIIQGSGGLYSGTNIVLFKRSATNQEISLRRPRGAIDAVGNSLAQRLSSISLKRET